MKIDTDKYRAKENQKIDLSKIDPNDTGVFENSKAGKKEARKNLKKQIEKISEIQNMFYADGSKSLLIVLQALDAGGKDGTIRKIMTGINPQGVRVNSFKAPSSEERAHDFLWRIHKVAPKKGMIGIFNRSHYEDVLVVRVRNFAPKEVWSKRFEAINNFEENLLNEGTEIIKIYLHIDKAEQKRRFEARLNVPEKNWKFNPGDLEDRALWDDYKIAFEDVFYKTSKEKSPWYIIPANNKWYRDTLISQIILDKLESMDLAYPSIDYDPSEILIPD
ncbi:MAG TPA: polyphosphate kinase 2 family protein [Trueperaceae bacterium]|nr:polyphosphate kinase 2 family protein [Trueperaceae bacterium]